MRSLITILLLSLLTPLAAQRQISVSYLDLGELRSSSHRDDLRRAVSLVDSLQSSIVALYGVESETVVRDLVELSNREYSYFHRDLDFYDGLDFALLYYGDELFVDEARSDSTWLTIEGEILSKTIAITLAHRGEKIREVEFEADVTLLMGHLLSRDIKRLGMVDLLLDCERCGEGDTLNERGWNLRGRIGVLTELPILRSGIYIADWMVTPRPISPHLPLFVLFDVE